MTYGASHLQGLRMGCIQSTQRGQTANSASQQPDDSVELRPPRRSRQTTSSPIEPLRAVRSERGGAASPGGERSRAPRVQLPVSPSTSSEQAPREIAQWGENANCYAYAMNCPRPTMSGARRTTVPGATTGSGVTPGPDAQAYADALIQGALADGRGTIRQLSDMSA